MAQATSLNGLSAEDLHAGQPTPKSGPAADQSQRVDWGAVSGTDLLRAVVSALQSVCAANAGCTLTQFPRPCPERGGAMFALVSVERSVFHSVRIPPMSIFDYAKRIARYSKCSDECFPLALMYIMRYSKRSRFLITFYNIHRLLISAIMVAAKCRDDIYFSNEYFASIGGVTVNEINLLETSLLHEVGWDLWVDPQRYYELVVLCCATGGVPLPTDSAGCPSAVPSVAPDAFKGTHPDLYIDTYGPVFDLATGAEIPLSNPQHSE
jgi:hypothetical protein